MHSHSPLRRPEEEDACPMPTCSAISSRDWDLAKIISGDGSVSFADWMRDCFASWNCSIAESVPSFWVSLSLLFRILLHRALIGTDGVNAFVCVDFNANRAKRKGIRYRLLMMFIVILKNNDVHHRPCPSHPSHRPSPIIHPSIIHSFHEHQSRIKLPFLFPFCSKWR